MNNPGKATEQPATTPEAEDRTNRSSRSEDVELFDYISTNLYTAVLSDALDDLGFRNQAMREYLHALDAGSEFAGWARTISCMDVFEESDDPYGLEIEAIDSLLPGEVAVVGTGQSKRNAPWGELLSTAAKARGARGAVVDGLVRDVNKINALGFPVVAAGVKPVDSRGRGVVVAYNTAVECAEVIVRPGDLVVADRDGVVVIPAAAVQQTVRLASDKASRENQSREELMQGRFLRDVYKKYGVL
jgi:4-hydroxy-4-methyl-2-oxoglutarate aldolase